VNTVRVLQDGDFVATHTEYNFFGPKAGFDIFRFENGLIVEHWNNLQEIAPAIQAVTACLMAQQISLVWRRPL
jgi:predicted SnoaL-like aldol condensation-catalyzing enzyme